VGLFYVDNYESFSLLKKLITSKDCIGRVAEFMHDVLINDICTFRHIVTYIGYKILSSLSAISKSALVVGSKIDVLKHG